MILGNVGNLPHHYTASQPRGLRRETTAVKALKLNYQINYFTVTYPSPFSAVYKSPTFLNELNKNYEHLVPYTIKLKKKSDKCQEIALKIKDFYFGDKPISRDTLQQLFDVSSIKICLCSFHHPSNNSA